tara:strand:+ start:215133 stop:217808 length:2676 start_codon:yes stop_codon:yes gene_type:complete
LGFSQLHHGAIDTSVAEKIYLQLDSQNYATDQTIWFKAIVTGSENHIPSELSGVLYVDFIGPNQKILAHNLVKLNQGIGSGHFEIQDDYVSGRYQIRAYTQWNLNFGEHFMFESYINLHDTSLEINKNPFEAFTITENNKGRFLLSGQLWPQRMGYQTEKQVQLYLDWGKGQDTVTIKRQGQELYQLVYEVPNKADWMNLTLDNGRSGRHTETVVLNDSLPNVQFFPESGRFVHGFRNKVGFKAIGLDGNGREIYGEVFNTKGNKITDFTSNHLGMGSFSLKADSTENYQAKIFLGKNKDSSFMIPLPEAVSKGSILSVVKAGDKIRINVASNDLKDRVYVKASCRGTDYYLIEGPLRAGYLISELPSVDLPEGIIAFTLMDSNKNAVAERLYFNESEKDRLNLALETNKTLYGRREEAKLNIQVSGSSTIPQPKNTDLSIIVIKKDHWAPGTAGNIRSYFLLNSELKGKIEEPATYFSKENHNKFNDLDALLLTQGWRNYKYPVKRQGRTFFWPHPGLTVKGNIHKASSKEKSLKDINITMVTFGEKTSFYNQQTDSLGKFSFLLEDNYEQKMKILLSASSAEGKKTNYRLSIDSIRTPQVNYEVKPFLRKPNKVESAVIAAKAKRDETKAIFDSLQGVTLLEEVVVTDYLLTPERKKAYNEFGQPDVIIRGETLRKQEKNWSYGLYSILLFNYGDQVEIERFSDGFMLAHIKGGRGEPTLLVVDGQLLTKEQYEFVPNMPPGIIEDVELIKYAKFFKKQYLTVFPETDPLEAPSLGHIISIYTKGGVGIHGRAKAPPGRLHATVDVFAPEKEFYAPKYNRPVLPDSQEPDLRSVIHWIPSLRTSENGKASARFYNGDVTGEYAIIVTAISEDGRIGYQEMMYHVEKENP